VFTAAPDGFEEIAGALAALGVPCSLLGTVTGPAPGMRLVSDDGQVTEMEGLGYDHFL
jgi:thiamine monophosphate kinase